MTCSKCGRVGEEHAFATFRDRKGIVRRRGCCKQCREQYAFDNFERLQAWRKDYNQRTKNTRALRAAERRRIARDYVDAFKARPCADCGEEWPPIAMDLDHVSGGKIKNAA